MQQIQVRTHRADTPLPETEQLAWKIAAFATGSFPIDPEVAHTRSGRSGTPSAPGEAGARSEVKVLQTASTRQTVEPTVTKQPSDLLPFVGGEHIDTPRGIHFTLPGYLQLVDWTGRAVRDDKRGAIPADMQPIFQYLGLNQEE